MKLQDKIANTLDRLDALSKTTIPMNVSYIHKDKILNEDGIKAVLKQADLYFPHINIRLVNSKVRYKRKQILTYRLLRLYEIKRIAKVIDFTRATVRVYLQFTITQLKLYSQLLEKMEGIKVLSADQYPEKGYSAIALFLEPYGNDETLKFKPVYLLIQISATDRLVDIDGADIPSNLLLISWRYVHSCLNNPYFYLCNDD